MTNFIDVINNGADTLQYLLDDDNNNNKQTPLSQRYNIKLPMDGLIK